jgi:hypothetical protein
MKKNQKTLRMFSLIIFSIGIIIGMVIAGGIVWSNLEASLFDAGISPASNLYLNCPVAITTKEIGKVSASIKNPVDREKDFFVRTHIAEGYLSLLREINQTVTVASNGAEKLSWEIYPEDAVYDRIVMLRVYVSPSYPIPSQGNFCGILVLNISGLTGMQFFYLLLGISLAGVIVGVLLWGKSGHPNDNHTQSLRNALFTLAIFVFGTILIGYFGYWGLGILSFAISILLIGIILGRFYSTRNRPTPLQ